MQIKEMKKIRYGIDLFRSIFHSVCILHVLVKYVAQGCVKSSYVKVDTDHIDGISKMFAEKIEKSYGYADGFAFFRTTSLVEAFYNLGTVQQKLNELRSMISSFNISYLKAIVKRQHIESLLISSRYEITDTQELQAIEIRTIALADATLKSLQLVQNELDAKIEDIYRLFPTNSNWEKDKQYIFTSSVNLIIQRKD